MRESLWVSVSMVASLLHALFAGLNAASGEIIIAWLMIIGSMLLSLVAIILSYEMGKGEFDDG